MMSSFAYRVLWDDDAFWCVVPNTPEYRHINRATSNGRRIRTMPDGELWAAINWCVTYMRAIYLDACFLATPPTDPLRLDVAAKLWLRDRPVFIAMIIEAVNRELTFEPATFDYLRRFVIEPQRQRGTVFGNTQPWRDPKRSQEQSRFRRLFKLQQEGATDAELEPETYRELDL